MPTLPNMGLITPTLGGDSGTWDDKVNACFALIDAHDHTSGKGTAVPVAGLDIDDDIAMGGNAVTGLASLGFNAVTALTTGSKRLFVSAADNELYWRTNAGTNVKLTDGSSINTTLVGGIVGDYSTAGAQVSYDSVNAIYTFKDHATPSKKWAKLASGPIRIYEFGTTESVYVELDVATALAANYTITLPAALPARTSALTITAAGIVAFDDSTRTMVVPGVMGSDINASHTKIATGYLILASSNIIYYPIPLAVGDQLIGFTIHCDKETAGTDTITARAAKFLYTDVTETLLGSGVSSSANAPGKITLTETLAAADTIAAGTQYYVKFTPGGATAALHRVFHLEIAYKRS
jgi:hypothetical protein